MPSEKLIFWFDELGKEHEGKEILPSAREWIKFRGF
jgi:hypothetical protein